MPQTSPYEIELSDTEREELESLARKYTAPYQIVVRAKIVLLANQGYSNCEIAARLDTSRQIVSKWRQRYFEERANGLTDQERSGRPPTFSPSGEGANQSSGMRTARQAQSALVAFFEQ
jgi:transposase-like protein